MKKGIRRSPSEAADAAFRELSWHDAKESMNKELERLIKTAQPEFKTVSSAYFWSTQSPILSEMGNE